MNSNFENFLINDQMETFEDALLIRTPDGEIVKMNSYDSLTGLTNRTLLEVKITRLEQKMITPLSIITADIKEVKLVNDTYGYKDGDQLIIKAAKLLSDSCPDDCVLGRWGSDEFVMILPGYNREEAECWKEKINAKDGEYWQKTFPIHLTIGVAERLSDSEALEQVIKRAENNMQNNQIQDDKNTRNEIIRALLSTMKEKSDETEEHALRMTGLSFKFGEALKLSNADIEKLSLIATMHDIGKVVISEEILKKPGSLNHFEWDKIKQHPEVGKRIVLSADSLFHIAEEISTHHERWDGNGYPFGLAGEDIPLLARIISIIDTYDVMTNGRSYKQPVSKQAALDEIQRCAGSQFDPNLVNVFIKIMG